jgi:thiol-disulfide isomerase/thioredoxin
MRTTAAAWSNAALIFSTVMIWASAGTTRAAEDVEIKIVKYPQLAEAIRQNKAKVIVVDFWADWCVPCKREFPNLVKLHEKYAKDGLVAVSVSLDDPHKDGITAAVLKFLRSRKASFTNFVLDESPEYWTKKFDTVGPPFAYVFDREGKWRRFQGAEHYGEIEALVLDFLKKN